ncbi:HAD family hydrolase [Pseudobutyrivibrio xylanivorans]|uniref:Phosphoglycolate phosphatase n=1 Tax=Pseudobutyrivibrio xylanivorans DSM 14809 TaxID=1123012 RepID=A0A1M6BJS8_PSEXY|nr:HAD-IA family hydrolase [Pseudobutyrivibrio xylanivorans]SHI48969.1 phosphoglycolate phosphatase [Pseudobutyrivibrio xylanivorans DSM 14809]
MKYEAILFDLDGTLLYTLEDLTDSINYMLDKYGFPTHSIDDVRRFVGNGLRKLVERALPEGPDYKHFEEFLKEFIEYYNCHNLIKTKPYDGVIETTEKLAALGMKMAIVTNKGQTASDSLIDDFFAPHITIVIGDDGIHKRKPDPEPIEIALQKLGIADKSKVLYIGDSEVDATTAENAGLDYILCTYGFRDMDVLQQFHPIAYVDSFDKILGII